MSPASRMARADQPDRGDVFFLVLGARRFGQARQSDPDVIERKPQLVACLEQESIEQGPVFALGIKMLDQTVERGGHLAKSVLERGDEGPSRPSQGERWPSASRVSLLRVQTSMKTRQR